ncbi:CPBP family intramembrane glutamic endopeptidase [Sinomonas cyclohexanicum]|uniref:CPBP family intramembrane glutamic endopeptidase n=1 Tax=Sinomonas cyclohexanicum TaxID=322009 RepID=UPI001E4E11BF|nr:CPBP family intramembrane glutamic endopeptidase [Corynebacterium cyclohexanicum]
MTTSRTARAEATRAGPSLGWWLAVVLALFVVVAGWPVLTSAASGASLPLRIAANLSPFVMIVGVLFVAARFGRMRMATAFGWSAKRFGRQILIGVALAAVTLTLTLLPAAVGFNVLGEGEPRPLAFAYLAIRTFVGVGFVEEFAWRGYVFAGANRLLGSRAGAVVVSSALFGLWHFPGSQDFLQVIMTALIGALYASAILTVRHCTTLATGLAHGLHDVTLLTLATLLR